MLNDETGNFDLIQLCDISSFGAFPRAIVSADFSGDNMIDIAVLSVNDTINVYQNLGWVPTDVDRADDGLLVEEFELFQNYPNPFNPSTTIKFQIPSGSISSLKIYNILGEKVFTLVNEALQAGSHEFTFNATNLSSGIYFYQLQTPNFTQTKKMILLK